MASHKGDRSFRIDVPRKRERNAFALSVAKGEAQKPRRMSDKRYKESLKEDWQNEDWGEDDSN